MFHVKLSADTIGGCLSVSFPEHVARNVMVYINNFPRKVVASHGLGMVSDQMDGSTYQEP